MKETKCLKRTNFHVTYASLAIALADDFFYFKLVSDEFIMIEYILTLNNFDDCKKIEQIILDYFSLRYGYDFLNRMNLPVEML